MTKSIKDLIRFIKEKIGPQNQIKEIIEIKEENLKNEDKDKTAMNNAPPPVRSSRLSSESFLSSPSIRN